MAIYTVFKGDARAEKTQFFGQNFPKSEKSAQKRLLGLFLQNFACGAKNFGQNRAFLLLSESSQNQFGRPKKRRQNFEIYQPPSRKSQIRPLVKLPDFVIYPKSLQKREGLNANKL